MPDEKAPKTRPMDRVHVLDFEPLHMGYPMASMKSVLLVDFEVQVHGLEEMSKKKKPVSIIVSAEGRDASACIAVCTVLGRPLQRLHESSA